MSGFFIFFLATVIVSVTSGRVQSMWDYYREHDTSVISSRIIQGILANPGDFPYHVRLKTLGGPLIVGFCGGSIIAPSWVLTAGHCTSTDGPIPILDFLAFYVEAGSVVANQPKQSNFVLFSNVYPHPEYSLDPLMNDIGLLKTNKAFDFRTSLVQPIKLVAANTDPATYVQQFITVSGFGATVNGGLPTRYLRYTKSLKVIEFSECQAAYVGTRAIPEASFCAKDTIAPISAVCSGDSGGPATLIIDGTLYLVGVISYALVPNCDNGPQGFTNVAEFVPWITSMTGPL